MTGYRIDREIGRGGMAIVYAGRDERLDRPVALKVLADHLAGNPEFRRRFLREARIAARLGHPNLVRTYDITEVGGLPSIVMELLPGGTLEGGRLSRRDAADVADALAYAHAQGVVHRDLKPANLLRAAGGSVKIADFGIARAATETLVTQAGTVLGTLRYLAPEQAAGKPVGPPADVYSLGVVLDELCDRTPELEELVGRCLAPEPADRPTAGDVAAALGGPAAAPTLVLARPRLTRSVRRLAIFAAVVAAAAIGFTALTLPGGPGGSNRVEPVRHATTATQQARNLESWLRRYSR